MAKVECKRITITGILLEDGYRCCRRTPFPCSERFARHCRYSKKKGVDCHREARIRVDRAKAAMKGGGA